MTLRTLVLYLDEFWLHHAPVLGTLGNSITPLFLCIVINKMGILPTPGVGFSTTPGLWKRLKEVPVAPSAQHNFLSFFLFL